MARATLTERVEVLERTVGELPARISAVERELTEFRIEVRAEFAAVRSELRAEIRDSHDSLRESLRGEIRDSHESLRAEIREGDAETRRFMRVLYEDLVDRIKTIGEGTSG